MWVRDFQGASEDGGGFVLYEQQAAVGVGFGEFLEESQQSDVRGEETGGEGG